MTYIDKTCPLCSIMVHKTGFAGVLSSFRHCIFNRLETGSGILLKGNTWQRHKRQTTITAPSCPGSLTGCNIQAQLVHYTGWMISPLNRWASTEAKFRILLNPGMIITAQTLHKSSGDKKLVPAGMIVQMQD